MKFNARLLAVFTVAACAVVGCAHFNTKQTDVSGKDKDGNPIRTITTEASTTTFLDSSSRLTAFKATQTDKTQGASVGSLDQSASGSNAVTTLRLLIEGAPIAK